MHLWDLVEGLSLKHSHLWAGPDSLCYSNSYSPGLAVFTVWRMEGFPKTCSTV